MFFSSWFKKNMFYINSKIYTIERVNFITDSGKFTVKFTIFMTCGSFIVHLILKLVQMVLRKKCPTRYIFEKFSLGSSCKND